MATFASADLDLMKAVERSAFYRQRYAEQIAANAELKAACRMLFTKWDEGKPSLNQVLERIRTLIEADDSQPPARRGPARGTEGRDKGWLT